MTSHPHRGLLSPRVRQDEMADLEAEDLVLQGMFANPARALTAGLEEEHFTDSDNAAMLAAMQGELRENPGLQMFDMDRLAQRLDLRIPNPTRLGVALDRLLEPAPNDATWLTRVSRLRALRRMREGPVRLSRDPVDGSRLGAQSAPVAAAEGSIAGAISAAVAAALRGVDLPGAPAVPARPPRKSLWNPGELLAAEFPPQRGAWPGLVPPGLTMLSGRPKCGKSILMMQLALALGQTGLMFDSPIERGAVMYFALEDRAQRLQQRIRRIGMTGEAQVQFATELGELEHGGLDVIEAAAEKHYKLIIIDTIKRCVPGDVTKDAARFGKVLGLLQSMALDYNTSIVAVTHRRKAAGEGADPVDDVAGSTELTAAADSVLTLYRDSTSAQLRGRGRDIEEVELSLRLDPVKVAWELLGKTEEVQRTENQEKILQALGELGKATARQVADEIGASRSHTSERLRQLVANGDVLMDKGSGVPSYYLPEEEAPDE